MRQTHNPRVVSSTPTQTTLCILGKGTWPIFPRLPQGALNRGAVCVRMHLRSCTDVKEPGWPSKSLGFQKQTDIAGMHKRPEDGMWLPTSGQIGNGHILISSLAHGERCKQARLNMRISPWAFFFSFFVSWWVNQRFSFSCLLIGIYRYRCSQWAEEAEAVFTTTVPTTGPSI